MHGAFTGMVLSQALLITLQNNIVHRFRFENSYRGSTYISPPSEESKFSRGFSKDKINCLASPGVADDCESNEKPHKTQQHTYSPVGKSIYLEFKRACYALAVSLYTHSFEPVI